MQTHNDSDVIDRQLSDDFTAVLKQCASLASKDRLSEITAGKEDEIILDEWDDGDLHLVQRPKDEQSILRISIGGGSDVVKLDYCVFRGHRTRCAYMLEQAAKALRERIVRDRAGGQPSTPNG